MTRILVVLFSLLAIGTAAAQPPVDYTLLCDGAVIGTATYVNGELHVAVVEGATCDGVLSVAQGDLEVTLERDPDGLVTITIGDMAAVAVEVPQRAIDGKVGASLNRAAAAERYRSGQENAAAKRGEHQPDRPVRPIVPEPPVRPIVPEPPVLPIDPDLPVLPVEPETFGRPERPVVPAEPEAPRGRRP